MRIEELNCLSIEKRKEIFSKCCGAERWINVISKKDNFQNSEELLNEAERTWYELDENDWLEAFRHHPKIGDINSLKEKYASTRHLAFDEQSGVQDASDETIRELARMNDEYEKKFGYIFIVCATGKSAEEMLSIIKERIGNEPEKEIKTAMEEQNKITKLRIEKLL